MYGHSFYPSALLLYVRGRLVEAKKEVYNSLSHYEMVPIMARALAHSEWQVEGFQQAAMCHHNICRRHTCLGTPPPSSASAAPQAGPGNVKRQANA